jgi:hypothetical protein
MGTQPQEVKPPMIRKPAAAHSGVALFTLAICILSAVGSSVCAQTSDTPAEFAYVVNSGPNNVSVFPRGLCHGRTQQRCCDAHQIKSQR